MLTSIVRGSPTPRSSMLCAPGFNDSATGVVCPLLWRSTNTCAPGGLLVRFNVPVAAVLVGAGERCATYRPTAARPATIPAASPGTIHRFIPLRSGRGSLPSNGFAGRSLRSGELAMLVTSNRRAVGGDAGNGSSEGNGFAGGAVGAFGVSCLTEAYVTIIAPSCCC